MATLVAKEMQQVSAKATSGFIVYYTKGIYVS